MNFAEAAAGWHETEPDAMLFSQHGSSFAALSGLSVMKRWPSWLLAPETAAVTVDWLHALLIDAVRSEGLDVSFLDRRDTKELWHRTVAELSSLEPVVLHADMHDGQLVLQPGASVIAGVIDWDNFCLGNPLVDFNTSKWFPDRMWLFRKDFHAMRVEMWLRYLGRRGIHGFCPGGLNLFCVMTETVRVVCEKDRPGIWMTKGPYREALQEYIEHLEEASRPDRLLTA